MRVIHARTIGIHLYLSDGRTVNVRSGRVIKPWLHFGRCHLMPYLRQWSHRNGRKRKVLTHVEIWEVFRGSVRKGMTIDHIDGDRLNPALWNLREVTQRDNNNNRRFRQ